MKKRFLRVLSIVVTVAILSTIFSVSGVFSASAEEVLDSEGVCGENVYWSFDSETGALTISGEGEIYADFSFSGYNSIKSVYIESGITGISEKAFSDCTGITSFSVDKNNEVYSSDSYGVLYNKDQTELIRYPAGNKRSSYTVSDSVYTICFKSFYNSEYLKSIEISDTVKEIYHYAFSGCDCLENIIIGSNVTYIGIRAFLNSANLTKITIPESVSTICAYAFSGTGYYNNPSNWENDVLYIGNYLIEAKNTISGSYKIKDGTKMIGDFAFHNCNQLTSIEIPDSVTSIGHSAFEDCTGLTSVTIPDSVTSIGGFAFRYCTGLTSVKIPEGVTNIDEHAFEYCQGLVSVYLPASLKTIGEKAFNYCSHITDVYYVGTQAQWNGISIATGNKRIKSANIHYEFVDEDIFGMFKYTLEEGNATITGIDDISYSGKITIPEKINDHPVIKIGDRAFEHCQGLTSVFFPSSIKSIGEYSFNYCSHITDVYYPGTEAQWNEITVGYANKRINSAVKHFGVSASPVITACESSTAVIDSENGFIYGLCEGITSLDGFVECAAAEIKLNPTAYGFGTGSTVDILVNGEIVDTLSIIIFGDVTGDGYADAFDVTAVTGIINWESDISEFSPNYIAADILNDGVVDETDLVLMDLASIYAYEIPQTR